MEPGWVVLLCSLFVQMFFTVLVHAGIRLSHTNTASARHTAQLIAPVPSRSHAHLPAQLIAPVPSNAVRGAIVRMVQSLADVPAIKYVSWGSLALNLFYFWCAAAALLSHT